MSDTPKHLCLSSAKLSALNTLTSHDIYKEALKRKTGSAVYTPRIAKYLERPENIQWSDVYKRANKVPLDTRTKEFQYRFLHDLLMNRYWLKKWNVQDSDKCYYCKRDAENILHMFWGCDGLKPFWHEFSEFCNNSLLPINIDVNTVFLGVEDTIVCYLIFAAKVYIYNTKVHDKEVNFFGFKQYLYRLRDTEFQIAKENHTTDQCVEKWSFL